MGVLKNNVVLDRRRLLMAIAAGFLSLSLAAGTACADDDGGNSGSGGGGGDNSGSGGDGGSDGGGDDGGNDNSGPGGGGDDDKGGDDHSGPGDGDDDRDDSASPSRNDQERIRDAVSRGDAAPLRDILAAVRRKYRGDIVRIRLSGSGSRMVYRIRVIDDDNRLIEVRVNAKTGKIVGAGGV